jgi:hypothetical protein
MVVTDDSRIVGKTAEAIGLSWRKRTTLLGLARRGTRITKRLRKTVVQPDDIPLLLAPSDSADAVVDWLGGLTLAVRGLSVTQDSKTWLAIALFGGAVTAASVGLHLSGCFTCRSRLASWSSAMCWQRSCPCPRFIPMSNGRSWSCWGR